MIKSSVYFSPKDYELIKKAAEESNMSLSAFVKRVAIKEAKELVGDIQIIDEKQITMNL